MIMSSTSDMGPLSLENFRNNLSASWRVVGLKTSNTTYQVRINDMLLLQTLIC
jgi:alpha-1,4-galacturonosyltransferase